LAAAPQPAHVQATAIAGLASLEPGIAIDRAVGLLQTDLDEPSVARILTAFLARKEVGNSLVASLKQQPPHQDTARLALRWLHDTARHDAGLVAVLNTAAGLGGEPLRATPDYVSQLVTETRAQGDAQRGAAIFRRMDLSCMTCHSVGGEGGNIGPDLNSIGSGQPLDFIIGAVLAPNREVKENYEAVEVTTKDGESYTGYRVRGEENEVVLRDAAQNQILRFRRDNVKSVTNRGSVMPPGLVDHLTRAELRDLFSYLSGLGKPVK
jgi:putative heme-binding domain-containing protein